MRSGEQLETARMARRNVQRVLAYRAGRAEHGQALAPVWISDMGGGYSQKVASIMASGSAGSKASTRSSTRRGPAAAGWNRRRRHCA